ncbi:uncharacterized protein EDB91DRAFT_1086704 [Suillus paluster]|uniref:uncharacterized protein n=1 Tax=Suillus paluster TaxID=48578 RepID=UPI001B871DAD|nr:uncharacterized protein EDB91DRAFT_1086704 [Suillus paluster]KAG1726730.1 hypothetical protein EDB91DRAFT_1086704 [Suillus paluster]
MTPMSTLMTQVPPHSQDTSQSCKSTDPLWLSITMTPYMAEPEEFVTVYEGSIEFEELQMLWWMRIFYNMPAQRDLKPPFYCVTQGRYIGVFPAYLWHDVKIELWTPGNYVATFFAVQSLVLGEHKSYVGIAQSVVGTSYGRMLYYENAKY